VPHLRTAQLSILVVIAGSSLIALVWLLTQP
jgi:hypothetical protein